jgi:hypothetical protein
LFEADLVTGQVYEFTPNGVQSTFAAGLADPENLAFNSAGDLFVSCIDGYIYEITPNGVRSTFATVGSGDALFGIAFEPVPEPSVMALTAIGVGAVFLSMWKRRAL